MTIIKQNPFRVLGLFGNSSEREIQKHIGIIKRYAEIGKHKSFENDFEFLGPLSRNLEDIEQAASMIEQAKNKLHYSIFWFMNDNQIDEIALSQLKNKNIDKAVEIWNKNLKEVTEKNFSSYTNLATLYLALSILKEQIEIKHLQKAIDLKGILIHSEYINNFTSSVTGDGIKIDTTSISKNFVEEIIEMLKPHLDKENGIRTNEFISLFRKYPPNICKYISDQFTEIPLSNIENRIEKAAKKRKSNPEDADKAGEELFSSTKSDIDYLRKILGEEDVQLQMIINKLANEILQCAIEFYNIHREKNSIDPGDDALRIAKYAGSIGASGQIKQRIADNSAIIQEWVDSKADREKQKIVSEEIAFIEDKFKWFDGANNSIENAKKLISSCKPMLTRIKKKLGSKNDFYIQISGLIVNSALNMVIQVVNRELEQLKYDQTKVVTLPSTISSALSLLNKMSSFDMNLNIRTRYNTNKKIISDTNSQLQQLNQRISRARQTSSSSGGCYIATMAYGNYDHPQVRILREFRDEKLANHMFGRFFIRCYYQISPRLVYILKSSRNINNVIRFLLNKFIKHIK